MEVGTLTFKAEKEGPDVVKLRLPPAAGGEGTTYPGKIFTKETLEKTSVAIKSVPLILDKRRSEE